MSAGGEAIVLTEKFGDSTMAVRIQTFDSKLFTDKFDKNDYRIRLNFLNGIIFH